MASCHSLLFKNPVTCAAGTSGDHFQHGSYQNSRDDRTDADTAQFMKTEQTGNQGYGNHGDIKAQLDRGEFDPANLRNCQHGSFAGQWDQICRDIEEDTEGDEEGAGQHHENPYREACRIGKESHEAVTKCGKKTKEDPHGDLQKIFHFKVFTQ